MFYILLQNLDTFQLSSDPSAVQTADEQVSETPRTVTCKQILTDRSERSLILTATVYPVSEEPNVIKYGTNQSGKGVDGLYERRKKGE